MQGKISRKQAASEQDSSTLRRAPGCPLRGLLPQLLRPFQPPCSPHHARSRESLRAAASSGWSSSQTAQDRHCRLLAAAPAADDGEGGWVQARQRCSARPGGTTAEGLAPRAKQGPQPGRPRDGEATSCTNYTNAPAGPWPRAWWCATRWPRSAGGPAAGRTAAPPPSLRVVRVAGMTAGHSAAACAGPAGPYKRCASAAAARASQPRSAQLQRHAVSEQSAHLRTGR